MNRLLRAVSAVLLMHVPFAHAAPDAAQRFLIERTQQAQRSLGAAQAACGAQREKLVREHAAVMQEVVAQTRTAKPGDGMSEAEMRTWIDEHLALMQKMMWQMTEHHLLIAGDERVCGARK